MSNIPTPLSGDRTDKKAPGKPVIAEDQAGLAMAACGRSEARILATRISSGFRPAGRRFSYQEYMVPAWN